MAEQLNRQQKRKVRRSIFIGLGGTGNEAIRRLKRDMRRHDFDLPIFQYAVMDTVAFDEKPGMDPLMRLRNGEEYIYIGNYNPNEVLKNLDSWPVIGNWWGNRRNTSLVTVDEGAGQMRAVGRMGFFYHFNSIEKQLRRMVQSIMDVNTREIAFERGFDVSSNGPIVYLVFSLCGGTGSGLFLDVAYALRQLLTFSDSPPTLVAVAMLPGPFLQAIKSLPQQERIQANTYAALMELERLHNIALGLEPRPNGRDLWHVQYSSNFQVASADLPFDYIYLLDDTTSKGEKYTRERMYEKTAQAIFWLSGPSTSATFWERAKNLSSKTLAGGARSDSSGTKRLSIYSSLGVSMIMYEWQVEQVQHEMENVFIERLCAQAPNKLSLPPSLNSAVTLIEEVSGEQSGVNPIPLSNELHPVGTFSDQAAVDDMLENFTTKYQAALNRLLTSPIWKKTKEQYLISMQKALDEYVCDGLCMRGPIALKHELEEAGIHLNALLTALIEKRQEQQTLKSQLETDYLEATRTPSKEQPFWQALTALRSVFSRIYLFSRFRGKSSPRARELMALAAQEAHQRYRWYDAGFKVLIYGDIIDSILKPLVVYADEQKKVLQEIESELRAWLARNKNNPQAAFRTQDRAWFELIRPRLTEGDQVQQAIASGRMNLEHALRQILKKTFHAWPTGNAGSGSSLESYLKQEIIAQLKYIGGEEHLAERLLSQDLSSEQRLFLLGAECLWNFARESNQETIPSLESIDLLGYGIDPRQHKTLAEVERIVIELLKDEPARPDLVPTDISDEMALIRTQHGLMISSLRTIKDMQQAYQVMKTVKRAPYLHIDATYQATVGYKPLVSLESTPQQIIDELRKAADRLDDKNSRASEEIREAADRFEQSIATKRSEQIDVDHKDHPFFDLVDQLRGIIEPLKKTPSVQQAQLLRADMEAILHSQGWVEIDPGFNDRFDPDRHEVFDTEQRVDMKPGRIIETIRPGYERQRPGERRQIRKALVRVSTR
jgi:molecular chaperone GrpE (heat shock protein)